MWRRSQGLARQLRGPQHARAGAWNGGSTPFCRQGRCEGHPCVCLTVSVCLCVSTLIDTQELIAAAHGAWGMVFFRGAFNISSHIHTHATTRNSRRRKGQAVDGVREPSDRREAGAGFDF